MDPRVAERIDRAMEASAPKDPAEPRPKYTNRLILETSPYLLQHAHNPVNWFPWGKEAFDLARTLHRPILLSVGYATCHWCHVMEVESFEDEEIAGFINGHFIPIKVDREERPDIDSVYMSAVLILNNGSGGWPMTVVMSAEGLPFFASTYLPPHDGDRGAQTGFLTVLHKLSESYTADPERILETGKEVSRYLQLGASPRPPQGVPGPQVIIEAARQLGAAFDVENGGFGEGPKFPSTSEYELLLRYGRRSGDANAVSIVERSLMAMIDGGIHDQIGGGFHRYATDQRWLVPHFEKMLYDQAQIALLLLEAHQVTKRPVFAATARETLDYVLREMTTPEGAFYSATDADSEGAEGRFFLWTLEQMTQALPEKTARIAAAHFGVTQAGNFEGKNILHRAEPASSIAAELGMSAAEVESEIAAAKERLREVREKRVHPMRDDVVLAEWNGTMMAAFARAALVLGEPRYLEAARRDATFILAHMRQGDRLLRSHRAGSASHVAVLEDYASVLGGLLELYEVSGEVAWLEQALALEAVVEAHYLDAKNGGFYETPDDGEALLVRARPTYDGSQPSGTSLETMNLLRLAELTQNTRYRALAEKTLGALGAQLEHGTLEVSMLASALDFALDRPKEVVIVASARDHGDALKAVLAKAYLPNRAIALTEEGAALDVLKKIVPLVENKRAIGGQATAYVCTERVCQLPTSSPAVFEKQLAQVEALPLGKKIVLPR